MFFRSRYHRTTPSVLERLPKDISEMVVQLALRVAVVSQRNTTHLVSIRKLFFTNTLVLGLLLLFFSHRIVAQETNVEVSAWSKLIRLKAGGGYKDNLLLGRVLSEKSAFALTGAEIFALRMPTNGVQLQFFLSFDDLRYFDAQTVDKEQTLIAFARVDKDLSGDWKAGLSAQYLYQDQVFDASSSDFDVNAVKLKAHGFSLRPLLHKQLNERNWSEAELIGTFQDFAAPLDDYWEGGGKFSLGHDYGRRSKIGVSVEILTRTYDTRTTRDLLGQSIPGESLSFQRHSFDFWWNHYWDDRRRWKTNTRAGLLINDDSGPGFYDYDRYQFSEQLVYRNDVWSVETQFRIYYYQYSKQIVGLSDTALRRLTFYSFSLRAERNLTKSWKIFAGCEHEQSLSNRSVDQYGVNTVSAGLVWELE